MITKANALKIAREECDKHGWPWREPVKVKRGLRVFTVWGGGRKGGNLCVKIRKKDGYVVSCGMTPK